MEIDAICKNKDTALLILKTVMKTVKSDTQTAALKAVADWIRDNNFDDYSKLTPEEQESYIMKIKIDLRTCMSEEERIEEAAFYLEGIEDKQRPLALELENEYEPEQELEYEFIPEPDLLVRKGGIGVVRTDKKSV